MLGLSRTKALRRWPANIDKLKASEEAKENKRFEWECELQELNAEDEVFHEKDAVAGANIEGADRPPWW